MNFSPLMGKFEGRYSLIAGTFFSYCQCFEISVLGGPTELHYIFANTIISIIIQVEIKVFFAMEIYVSIIGLSIFLFEIENWS